MKNTLFRLAIIASGITLFGCGSGSDNSAPAPSKVTYLNQAWSEQDRADYYWLSQGSALISYDIYLALKLADSNELFNSATFLIV